MFGVKEIIITIALLFLFGSYLADFFGNLAFLITCGFCKEGVDKMISSIGSIVTLGQSQVKEGALGMIELKDNGCIPEYTTSCTLTSIQVNGLMGSYKNNLLKGTAVTLIYIIIFFLILNKGSQMVTGFPIPFLWALLSSLILVGVIQWVFSGFQELPYGGFILLLQNTWIWGTAALKILQPG